MTGIDEIARVQLLTGHVDADTAYTVDDYPYGYRLRCKIRYWIETAKSGAKRGDRRVVSQTTDPKRVGEPWNKPKSGTYSPMAWLYLNENGHVQWTGIGTWGPSPEGHSRLTLMGIINQMPADQRGEYDRWLSIAQKSNATGWEQWAETLDYFAARIRETGEPPALDNGSYDHGERHRYLGTENYPVAVAVARQMASA